MIPARIKHEELHKFCLNLIVSAPSTVTYHNYIIGYNEKLYEPRKKYFEKIFLKNLNFIDFSKPDVYGFHGFLGGFLTKARILNGDESLKFYNIETVSEWEYKVKADCENIAQFSTKYEHLPYNEEIDIDVKPGSLIEVYIDFFIYTDYIVFSVL